MLPAPNTERYPWHVHASRRYGMGYGFLIIMKNFSSCPNDPFMLQDYNVTRG
jgi:hypothetical protein